MKTATTTKNRGAWLDNAPAAIVLLQTVARRFDNAPKQVGFAEGMVGVQYLRNAIAIIEGGLARGAKVVELERLVSRLGQNLRGPVADRVERTILVAADLVGDFIA